MFRHLIAVAAVVTGFAAGAIVAAPAISAQAPPSASPSAASAIAKNDYSDTQSWLCRPGRSDDACAVDLTTTIVAADGTLTKEAWAANPKAAVDCFYVYPTVSGDQSPNSDMNAGSEELNVVRQQFARFASQCRPFAPLYRQVTLSGLRAAMAGGGRLALDQGPGYNDVRDSWTEYLKNDNNGRGVVLIGHSQGAMVLTKLIADEIDGKPVQSRLISAILLGTNVAVPKGKDVDGAFKHIPVCRSADQTGCLISYASFRSTVPPPANTLFGRVAADGMESVCTNPAALGGGSGALHAYLTGAGSLIASAAAQKHQWVTGGAVIETPFVSVPGLLNAKCAANEHGHFLEVAVNGDPADPRADDIPGDLGAAGRVQANWGLHLIDANLAMGNLVDIVGTQAKAFLAKGTQSGSASAARNDYARPEAWLCRPGLAPAQDACAVDLTTTVVSEDGRFTREAWAAHPNPPIDCFYVYPTVSLDPSANSDMVAGAEERNVVRSQFARFASQCRPFAPLYRQFTLTALRANTAGKPMAPDRTLAYNDVLDAWNHYLTHDNKGRGVVLIGHSQGSGVLAQLIGAEIDGKPIQSRVISALLLGTNVAVPSGKDVGGGFHKMSLCRSADQIGCVISYVTFRATAPPPAESRFGRVQGEGMQAACTNPAALAGGKGQLHAYLSATGREWVTPVAAVSTPYVSVPGLLTGQCVTNEKGSYLAVTVNADPHDPRTDEIGGDVVTNGKVVPSWGLHLVDVHIALGNLIDIVGKQGAAYLAKKTSTNQPH